MDQARRALRPLERVVVFFGGLILAGALLIGLGLITLGRLMAATVPMREELDATV